MPIPCFAQLLVWLLKREPYHYNGNLSRVALWEYQGVSIKEETVTYYYHFILNWIAVATGLMLPTDWLIGLPSKS